MIIANTGTFIIDLFLEVGLCLAIASAYAEAFKIMAPKKLQSWINKKTEIRFSKQTNEEK